MNARFFVVTPPVTEAQPHPKPEEWVEVSGHNGPDVFVGKATDAHRVSFRAEYKAFRDAA